MEINLELLSNQNPWWMILNPSETFGSNFNFGSNCNIGDAPRSLEVWDKIDISRDGVYKIFGSRGSGKTTAIKEKIRKMIGEEGINPDNIFYYSCHSVDTFERLNQIIKTFLEWRRNSGEGGRLFIFLDEIFLLKDVSIGLDYLKKEKRLKNVSIIISGPMIDGRELNDNNLFIKPLLNFSAFLQFIDPVLKNKINRNNYSKYQKRIDYYLDVYFLTGGLLASANNYKKNGYIEKEIYDHYYNWLMLDFARIGRDTILLGQIIEELFSNLGLPVGYRTIARKTKAKMHLTVSEYLKILEKVFAVKMVCQLDKKGKPTTAKAKKIYFSDPFFLWSFYSYIYGPLDSWKFAREHLHKNDIFLALAEGVVFNHLESIGNNVGYWRDSIRRKEINFIFKHNGKTTPIIIRHGKTIDDEDKNIFKIAGFKEGIIISNNELSIKSGMKIIPLSYFLLFCEHCV